MEIRVATVADAEQLREIYAYYVLHTAITFEYEVPSVEEFADRIATTLHRYPYLVAQKDGKIAGYAYAGPFKERAAYDWAVETSIYVQHGREKEGIGKRLYLALEQALKAQNILNVNACIAYPKEEDPYLTKNSVEFHTHLGYRMVGKFQDCGYKFGRWYHMVWMEKAIGVHVENPEPVIWFSEHTEAFGAQKEE